MLVHEIQRLGLPELDENGLNTLARQFDRTPDELYVALGCGDFNIARVVNKLVETKETDDVLVVVPASSDAVPTEAITVLGLKGLLTSMAKCCNPMPGDPIVGYITRGRGATIHRQDCPNILRATERERLVRVSWGEKMRTYPVPIRITAFDRQGLMGDISTLLNTEGVNIVNVNVHINHDKVRADVADIRLIVEVKDIAQLSRMLNRIENLANVLDAQRMRGG